MGSLSGLASLNFLTFSLIPQPEGARSGRKEGMRGEPGNGDTQEIRHLNCKQKRLEAVGPRSNGPQTAEADLVLGIQGQPPSDSVLSEDRDDPPGRMDLASDRQREAGALLH